MNIWHFDGRLGRDAELRTTQGGEKVLSFAVANDIGFGERKTTQWVDCSIWGTRAEKLAPFLKRGTEVSVAGEVTLSEFERRDGSKDKALKVRVMELSLHGGQGQGRDTDSGNGRSGGQSSSGNGSNGGGRGTSDTGRQGGPDRQGGQGRGTSQNPSNRGQGGSGQDGEWDNIPF